MGNQSKILHKVYNIKYVPKSVEMFRGHSPLKFKSPKSSIWISWFCDFVANNSGTEQDIVNRKSVLKTTDTPLDGTVTFFTLIHKQKVIDHSFHPTYINFSKNHISDAKGLCSLKILS